ncbi:hypothetical protein JCM5353_008387 [Sporobolomyces roseus]
MRSFVLLALLPFLVNAAAPSPVEESQRREKRWIWGPSIVQDGETDAPPPGSNANLFSGTTNLLTTPQAQPTAPSFPPRDSSSSDFLGSLSFNSSTTTRAPRSTKTPHARVHRQKSRQDKRYYQGSSIIQDPQPGDTASLPPIGGGHTTPDAGGLTPPTFPPRPSPTPSSTSTESTSEVLSSTELEHSDPSPPVASSESPSSASTSETLTSPATSSSSHWLSPVLAENQRLRSKAWNSFTSRLAMESRLAEEAKTRTSTSKSQETGIVWTKIRDYRDKIPGRDTLHRVVRRDAGALKLVKKRMVDSE